MNYIKRATTSITRQIQKSLILFLIVTILGTVMISTLLVTQAVEANKKAVLKSLPPIVEIKENYEIYQSPDFDWEKASKERKMLTPTLIEQIIASTSDLIKDSYFASYSYIRTHKTFKHYSFYENMGSVVWGSEDSEFSMFASLTGVQNGDFKELAMGKAKILHGRSFSDDEIKDGSPVVVLSKELAEANGLTVGSKIKSRVVVEKWDEQEASSNSNYRPEAVYHEDMELEVIGIIEYSDRPSEKEISTFSNKATAYEQQANIVFTPNNFNAKIQKIEAEYGTNQMGDAIDPTGSIDDVTFILKDPKDAQKFVDIAKTIFDDQWMKYITQEEQYNKVSKPLDDIQSTMNLVFYLTVGASVLVLSLVLIGFAKDRKKEIGIYLALGEKKGKIAGQLTIESVIVTFIAATLAIGLGLVLAMAISSTSIPTEIVSDSTTNVIQMGQVSAELDYSEIVNGFKIGLSVMSIVLFYIAMIGSALIAQIISSFYTLRLDPKKIMM